MLLRAPEQLSRGQDGGRPRPCPTATPISPSLIDADNAQPADHRALLAEVAKYGVASVKRIYGDWTEPNLGGWKEQLLAHSIQPIQQFAYTTGKNATDARDDHRRDGPALHRHASTASASSPATATSPAWPPGIRESGLTVYGFGERKTPEPFVAACDKFIYTEIFRRTRPTRRRRWRHPRSAEPRRAAPGRPPRGPVPRRDRRGLDENGWAGLGAVGNIIVKQAPDFDPRNYGYTKLSDLAEAIGLFTLTARRRGAHRRHADVPKTPVKKTAKKALKKATPRRSRWLDADGLTPMRGLACDIRVLPHVHARQLLDGGMPRGAMRSQICRLTESRCAVDPRFRRPSRWTPPVFQWQWDLCRARR